MRAVRVHIIGKDRRVGAMVKALAVEIAGFNAVKGTTKDFLAANGFYDFHFQHEYQADDFRKAVSKYISQELAIAAG